MVATKKFIRIKAVLEKVGLSRASIYARLDPRSRSYDSTFPRPIKLGESSRSGVAWLEDEVDSWITSLASRRATENPYL